MKAVDSPGDGFESLLQLLNVQQLSATNSLSVPMWATLSPLTRVSRV